MSLKEASRERLLVDMLRSVKTASGWKVLVVDHDSTRVISSCCRMYDITEEGVTIVENLEKRRQPLPELEAVYFITPTEASINLVIEDYKGARPQYSHAHLFFTSRLPDPLFSKLSKSPALAKIKSFKELNLEFLAYESQVFTLDMKDSFISMYSRNNANQRADIRGAVTKLMSVCLTLNEFPYVRFMAGSPSDICQQVATQLQDALDQFFRQADVRPKTTNRPTLLIVDRSLDVIAPLVHEFTYQAMCYDLLPIENDHFKYKTTTNTSDNVDKEVIMGENDSLWITLRHMHIADCINWVLDNFNDFLSKNKASKLAKDSQVSSLREMRDAIKDMPQYQELLNKYSLHIHMAGECMNLFKQKNLESIASLEQDLATGEDPEGRPPRNLVSTLTGLLTRPDIDKQDKVRLLMMYIISQEGIKDEERRRLLDTAGIPLAEQHCFLNLANLNVAISRANKAKKKNKKKDKRKPDDVPFELSRFNPALKDVMEELATNKLPTDKFPYVRDEPSPGAARPVSIADSLRPAPKWVSKQDKQKKEGSGFDEPKYLVFVLGGMTFSETRNAYKVSKATNHEIIIGSTHVWTPKTFLQAMAQLG